LPHDARLGALLERLAPGEKHVADILELLRRTPEMRGFVYAWPRTVKSYAFLFVGDTSATLEELVDRFAALTAASEGLLVELGR
jgi:hypothetical protein